jgi:hypothetical protein
VSLQADRALIGVDLPDRALLLGPGQDGRGVEHGEREGRIGPAGAAIGREANDLDRQRIAGLGAFDEKGAGHRVGAAGDGGFRRVEAGGIHRIRHQRIAIGDAKAGLGRAERVVIAGRVEVMFGHAGR